jgi:hypothetical protein
MEVRWPSISEWRHKFVASSAGRWMSFLGSLQLGWRLLVTFLDWKGTVEEAIATGYQITPFLGSAFAVIFSPGFGFSLVLLGFCYIAFVPPQQHPASARVTGVVAWVACFLSGAALSILVALTLVLVANAPRHLTSKQKDTLTSSLAAGPDVSGQIAIVGYESCLDCPAYAWDIAGAMNDIGNKLHKWKYQTVPIFSTNGFDVRLHGIVVRVWDKNHLPPSGRAVTSALNAAGIPYQVANYPPGLPTWFKERAQMEVMPR